MTEGRPAQRSWRYTLVSAALGIGAVLALVVLVNAGSVVSQIGHAAAVLPIAFALEGGVLACETLALWCSYGSERRALALGDMVQAALVGYPSMVLLPAGRSVAEAVRAGVLAKRTTWQLATSVAVDMQVVLLAGVSAISLLGAIGAWVAGAGAALVAAVMANCVLTAGLAIVTFTLARRTGIGGWLASKFRRFDGAHFGEMLRNRPAPPLSAFAATFAGRVLQVLEIGLLFFGVSGHVELPSALAVEGIHMVGASLGDLLPNQLGATDATFTLAGQRLGLTASSGLTIALMAHATQAAWAVIGGIIPLVTLHRRAVRQEAQ